MKSPSLRQTLQSISVRLERKDLAVVTLLQIFIVRRLQYWPDPKALVTGLFQAVPRAGRISVESTGNGAGDYYHSMCMRSSRGNGRFKLHFLPWYTFPEYALQTTPEIDRAVLETLDETYGELELVNKYKITPGQILWRRDKLEEMEYDLRVLNQEYPTTLGDCFQALGSGIFYKIFYTETPDWERRDTFLWTLRGHPIKGHGYVCGADVSGGVYRDSSVIEVFDCETHEQVAEWLSNRISPDIFATHIAATGELFNQAYVSVESNNHGIVTLSDLKKIYPSSLIHRMPSLTPNRKPDEIGRLVDLGSRVTSRTKPYLIGKLRKSLAAGAVIHSPVLKSELNTFVEFEDGTMGAQQGTFDDCVMAAAHAFFALERAAMIDRSQGVFHDGTQVPDAFSLESIIAEMTKSRTNAIFQDVESYENFNNF
jgi:hypothetical protein